MQIVKYHLAANQSPEKSKFESSYDLRDKRPQFLNSYPVSISLGWVEAYWKGQAFTELSGSGRWAWQDTGRHKRSETTAHPGHLAFLGGRVRGLLRRLHTQVQRPQHLNYHKCHRIQWVHVESDRFENSINTRHKIQFVDNDTLMTWAGGREDKISYGNYKAAVLKSKSFFFVGFKFSVLFIVYNKSLDIKWHHSHLNLIIILSKMICSPRQQ